MGGKLTDLNDEKLRKAKQAFVKKLPSGQWQITPTTMNKKRKILTLVALLAFGAIILSHYYGWHWQFGFGEWPVFPDIRMPLFVLAVFYAGVFFLFGGKDAASVPRRSRNWRRIKIIGVILAGLVVIVGLIAAIIHVQEQEATRQRHIESEKRQRAEKIEKEKKEQAEKIEEEASKHRITSSEIDLLELQFLRLKSPQNDYGSDPFSDPFNSFAGYKNGYVFQGRIRNRSSHTLASIKLIVKLRDKSGDLRGEKTARIPVNAPPGQTRAIGHTIYFDDDVYPYTWDYAVTEIRGSKGDFDPDEYLRQNLTPTPSPKP